MLQISQLRKEANLLNKLAEDSKIKLQGLKEGIILTKMRHPNYKRPIWVDLYKMVRYSPAQIRRYAYEVVMEE